MTHLVGNGFICLDIYLLEDYCQPCWVFYSTIFNSILSLVDDPVGQIWFIIFSMTHPVRMLEMVSFIDIN